MLRGHLDDFISFARSGKNGRKKALTAAAANYGSPMMWVDGHTEPPAKPIDSIDWKGTLVFTQSDLEARYEGTQSEGKG